MPHATAAANGDQKAHPYWGTNDKRATTRVAPTRSQRAARCHEGARLVRARCAARVPASVARMSAATCGTLVDGPSHRPRISLRSCGLLAAPVAPPDDLNLPILHARGASAPS